MKNKLTKKQILKIPVLLDKYTIDDVAKKYKVSWQTIWYHIGRLRKNGVNIITRTKGKSSLIYPLKQQIMKEEKIESAAKHVHLLLYNGNEDAQYIEWRNDLEAAIFDWIDAIKCEEC